MLLFWGQQWTWLVHLYRKLPTLCRLFEVLLIKNWLKWHKYRHKVFAFIKKPNINLIFFFYFYGVNSDQDWCIYKENSLGFADFLKFGAYIGLWCEKLQWRMILQCPCQHGSSWPVINWLKKNREKIGSSLHKADFGKMQTRFCTRLCK